MKRILMIAILIISVFIQGCATWEYRPDRASSDEPGGYEKNYQLGVKKSAFIGQEIISIKKYNKIVQSAQPLNSATITAGYKTRNITLRIDEKNIYTLHETINLDKKYYLLLLDESYDKWSLLISSDGMIFQQSLYNSYHQMVYTPDGGISIEPRNSKLLLIKTYDQSLFSFQLIYSGKNDVSLNTTYREYTGNDIARPAFFQNLTYEANAKQIRFKDFLIQIDEVTNEKITYTILEDGLK